jgi:hypothetical protein
MMAHMASDHAGMVLPASAARWSVRSRQSRALGWSGGRAGGRPTGTTWAGQRTAVAVGLAPGSSPSRGHDGGTAAAQPSYHRGHARLVREGRARTMGAPGLGSPAPDREQGAPWDVMVATGGPPQALRRRRTLGSPPRRGAAGAQPWSVSIAERAARGGGRMVGTLGCNWGTASGLVGRGQAGAVGGGV